MVIRATGCLEMTNMYILGASNIFHIPSRNCSKTFHTLGNWLERCLFCTISLVLLFSLMKFPEQSSLFITLNGVQCGLQCSTKVSPSAFYIRVCDSLHSMMRSCLGITETTSWMSKSQFALLLTVFSPRTPMTKER